MTTTWKRVIAAHDLYEYGGMRSFLLLGQYPMAFGIRTPRSRHLLTFRADVLHEISISANILEKHQSLLDIQGRRFSLVPVYSCSSMLLYTAT